MDNSKSNINISPELSGKLLKIIVENVFSKEDSNSLSKYDSISEQHYIDSIENETNEVLKKFRLEIKDYLVKKFDDAIQKVKIRLNSESSKYDDFIKLECRYNRVNSIFLNGRIDYQSADLEFTKIENTFIFLINEIKVEDLK